MKALVTGAAGFLGSSLVARLAAEGFAVRALVRDPARAHHLEAEGVEVVAGDLKNGESLRPAVEGIDTVFHAGAATRGDWQEYEQSTIEGTERILALSQAAGVRKFIHISSVAVYRAFGLAPNAIIDESFPLEPLARQVGPYAHSKVEAEKKVLRYAKQGLPVVIVRPGLIYGPRSRVLFPHLGFPVKGKLFITIGSGRNLLPFTYIENTIDAILLAAAGDEGAGQAYNIVDEQEITVQDYLGRFMAATGARYRVVTAPLPLILGAVKMAEGLGRVLAKPGPTVYGFSSKYTSLRYSSAKIARELGWRPRVDLEEGLAKTFAWYMSGSRNGGGAG
jgi:2-alkyl-3-oxoalkanoate reductase